LWEAVFSPNANKDDIIKAFDAAGGRFSGLLTGHVSEINKLEGKIDQLKETQKDLIEALKDKSPIVNKEGRGVGTSSNRKNGMAPVKS
jgi:hypothetical protein